MKNTLGVRPSSPKKRQHSLYGDKRQSRALACNLPSGWHHGMVRNEYLFDHFGASASTKEKLVVLENPACSYFYEYTQKNAQMTISGACVAFRTPYVVVEKENGATVIRGFDSNAFFVAVLSVST